MELRPLGSSDVRITPVLFGAWAIGGWLWGGTDEQDSIAAIQAAIDAGVTTIDTASAYGMGYSERLVARAIEGRRDKVVIATKGGMRWEGVNNDDGRFPPREDPSTIKMHRISRPEGIIEDCEASLRRLNVDVIDLYQLHWPDPTTPVEDSIAAMAKLKQQGKIRAIGVSNYDVGLLRRALTVTKIDSLQPPYSVLRRGIEADLLPFCREHNIAVIVYSPMERGLLTGKVTPDRTFPPGDHRAGHKFFTPENRQRVLDALKRIEPIAQKHNASFAKLIINWTYRQPGITGAIVGARNAEQARHNAEAMRIELTADELAQIRAVFDEPARLLAQ